MKELAENAAPKAPKALGLQGLQTSTKVSHKAPEKRAKVVQPHKALWIATGNRNDEECIPEGEKNLSETIIVV
jgi:hypothetical protein